MGSYAFPPEFVKPELKELPEYGLQYVLAAWHATDRFGSGIFSDDAEINSLIEIAQGRQSTDNIRKLFGQFQDKRSAYDDGPNSLVYIDPQVLNLAPKYINRAVAKMQMRQFDVGLEAIDLLSVNEKADFEATINAYYSLREWTQSMGVPLQAAFEGLAIGSLPDHPDEMLYDMLVNPKLQKEIAGELALSLIQSMNNFKQKMREVNWNMVVTGWGHFDCYNDHNNLPRIKVIPHEYWGGSYVDNDNFEEQEYAFYIEPITVNQFIKEAHPFYNKAELEELAYRYSIQNAQFTEGLYAVDKFDNLSYIPVVRFYFLSEDNRTFIKRNNQYGSKILMERDYNYYPAPEVQHRFDRGGDSSIIRNSYTSVYGGSWIVNSNIVYNYGRKNIPRTNLVNTTLPIKTFATNYKKGRAVSFTSQIIDPLHMINVAWNKVKETLAKGWMGIRNLDLGSIEQTALGKGGNVWTPREVVEYLNMSNTAVGRRTAGNQYGQSNGDIVTVTPSGVQLADYFNTITIAINFMDQLTGQSVIESANVPDRLPAKAIPAAQMSSDIDMEYLYNAYEYLYERTCNMLLLLTQESLKDPNSQRYFVQALGKVNTSINDISRQVAYSEFGFRLTKKPTQEEWIDFYDHVRLALEAGMKGLPGGIKFSDAILLREIDNLKQARQMMVIKENQYRREMMEMKQMDNQMAMEANQASAAAKFQADQAILNEQGKIDAYLKELQGKIDMMKQDQKVQLDYQTKRITEDMSRLIKDMEGRYSVLKEGMRSQSEQYKSDRKLEGDVYKANKAQETAKETAKEQKKKLQKSKA